ncbi:MAG TPA: helix-turn-helix transcriptional regulator [Spirochaetota bacterium]|nr:helix-turn-helix transcriptional regulator [Spirochaetota bacterium]
MAFGEFIKDRRNELGLSLREFCKQLDEDASNWSKVERGILSPPQDEGKLRRIAKLLNIGMNSEEWNMLTDYAKIDAGKIPDYLMSDQDVLKALPVFFRTIGSVKPTPEELAKLIEIIRKEGK